MIAAATKRIWITNAYFVPSRGILGLLMQKSARGVDVRLLVAGKKSDSKTSFGFQQAEYDDLLAKRIRIWEYQPSMLHAKTMLVDDDLVLIGSIDLEPCRSRSSRKARWLQSTVHSEASLLQDSLRTAREQRSSISTE